MIDVTETMVLGASSILQAVIILGARIIYSYRQGGQKLPGGSFLRCAKPHPISDPFRQLGSLPLSLSVSLTHARARNQEINRSINQSINQSQVVELRIL